MKCTTMVEGGVASKWEEPIWLNETGSIANEEKDAFGLKSPYILLHPKKLLFVDEVGNNTNQVNDGNVGGEKFLCFASGQPQHRANMKDSRFTILGFAAASGEPVMCFVIFTGKELEPMMVQGLDPFATWEGDELDLARNTGPGK